MSNSPDQNVTIKLSVIDISWPGHVPRLVQQLDHDGYLRFWASEHHSIDQCGSPTLLAAIAATLTTRIRIGTAGVLLHYACPAKVAEDFRLLELFFPNRIDLGIAGARLDEHEEIYLDSRPPPSSVSYAERVRALVDLMRSTHVLSVGPKSSSLPPLWLCGTSRSSAELAGSLGMHFAFHHYLSQSSSAARDAIATYRDCYRSPLGEASYALIACYGACADSDEHAARQWGPTAAGRPCFVGSPANCIDQLRHLAEQCNADEIAISLFGGSLQARLAGYRNLAQAAGLKASPGPDQDRTHSRFGRPGTVAVDQPAKLFASRPVPVRRHSLETK